ncbi:hypothetical protein H634G_11010 [Metarhizium anisopliae BRIP 53293]|uniref:Uncharacterized protein n=1 Tax=Metarhizium anisopliae BRIP 53293 TaxID=1291518 RepID=A0A0D9NM74_METAN|nr:hypothetical protein H634G_11010 [Metarhizium anisopliae BRIP 53293]KJK85333.1 hypothetical protein H633G_10826 [Metarhizium anisopliae BRIP 53284]
MSETITLTRYCWNGSVGNLAIQHDGGNGIGLDGALRSGLGVTGPKLSRRLLLKNFSRHRISRKVQRFVPEYATALASASDRILDTLARSLHKHYVDGVPAEEIHIIFIQISESQRSGLPVHSARELAEELQVDEPYRFHHEYVFEWAIPDECVVHTVTLKTLLNRGLSMEKFLLHGQFPTTRELSQAMAEDFFRDADAWEVGLQLGFFGRYFGANAPTNWIVNQLYWDMVVKVGYVLGEPEYVRVRYPDGEEDHLDRHFLAHMKDGMDTCLIDWWLLDVDFVLAVREFEDWKDLQEELLLDSQIDFYLDWEENHHHADFVRAKKRLEEREMRLMASIESESIRVGL